MATQVFRGKAQVSGFPGTMDAILYAIQQTGKMNQQAEEQTNKDSTGQDCAWRWFNERGEADIMLELLDSSVSSAIANAKIPATAVAASGSVGGSVISGLGQPFLQPGSVINLSSFAMTCWNGAFQVLPGDVDQSNVKTGQFTLKLRKYADSAQNTLATTTPS